ncbi:MAG: sce7726 family protein [Lachnotalea sp.]
MLYDKDIREPLFDYLEEKYHKVRILEEKRMGRSRADTIMITVDSIIGIEIKSDADTYERLKRQVKDYNKFCDKNYIVVGKSHAKHIEKHVPIEWGILIIDEREDGIVIDEKRELQDNPKRKMDWQIRWLWRPELNHILELNHLPKYKQKNKAFVQQKLLEKVEIEILKCQMCEELFERDYTLWDEMMEEYLIQKK